MADFALSKSMMMTLPRLAASSLLKYFVSNTHLVRAFRFNLRESCLGFWSSLVGFFFASLLVKTTKADPSSLHGSPFVFLYCPSESYVVTSVESLLLLFRDACLKRVYVPLFK